MFEKIFIVEDEIGAAHRIVRACRKLGVEVLMTRSSAPNESAPESSTESLEESASFIAFESSPAEEAERLLDVALERGAQAIHVGFLGLSQQIPFLQGALSRSLHCVGASTLNESLRDRVEARRRAAELGIQTVPALWSGPSVEVDAAAAEWSPQTLVHARRAGETSPALLWQEREAAGALPPFEALADGWIDRPRHVEITLLRDAGGSVLLLPECERSIRWRFGRVLDECPSPALQLRRGGEAKREVLRELALRFVEGMDFVGILSLRFLLDVRGQWHFCAAEPGLSPKHSLLEMATGLDLIELQLRIAAGEEIPEESKKLTSNYHAVMAYLRAEDPDAGLRPTQGEIESMRWPPLPQGRVRIEPWVLPPVFVDGNVQPCIAQLGASGLVRHRALLLLDRLLATMQVRPLKHNASCLRGILADESFRAGQYDCAFLERSVGALATDP